MEKDYKEVSDKKKVHVQNKKRLFFSFYGDTGRKTNK